MKTIDELEAIKEEIDALNKKFAELTDEELKQVTGGNWWPEYYGEDGFLEAVLTSISPTGTVMDKKRFPLKENLFLPSKNILVFNYKRQREIRFLYQIKESHL